MKLLDFDETKLQATHESCPAALRRVLPSQFDYNITVFTHNISLLYFFELSHLRGNSNNYLHRVN